MKRILIFFFILFIISVSSCSGSDEEAAAKAAEEYLQALAAKDKTALVNLSCQEWEEQASLEVDALLSVGAELNNLNCEVLGEEGNDTLVNCSGALDLTYNDEIRSIDLSTRTYHLRQEGGRWRVCSYR